VTIPADLTDLHASLYPLLSALKAVGSASVVWVTLCLGLLFLLEHGAKRMYPYRSVVLLGYLMIGLAAALHPVDAHNC